MHTFMVPMLAATITTILTLTSFFVVDAAVEEIGLLRQKIADIESDLSLEYDVTISVAVKPAEQVRRYATVLPYYANVIREGIRIHEAKETKFAASNDGPQGPGRSEE